MHMTPNNRSMPSLRDNPFSIRVLRPHFHEFKRRVILKRLFFHKQKKGKVIRHTPSKRATIHTILEIEPIIIAKGSIKSLLSVIITKPTIRPSKLRSFCRNMNRLIHIRPRQELITRNSRRNPLASIFMSAQNNIEISNKPPRTRMVS